MDTRQRSTNDKVHRLVQKNRLVRSSRVGLTYSGSSSVLPMTHSGDQRWERGFGSSKTTRTFLQGDRNERLVILPTRKDK